MKNFFLLFFSLLLVNFILPVHSLSAANSEAPPIMSQGSTRTCLHVDGQPTGVSGLGNKEKMKMHASLNLEGQCVSGSSGCEIWLHNSENTNIAVNEKMLKYCKNGEKSGNRNYCDRTDEIEEEIKTDVDIKPGWRRVTNFNTLSSKPGETVIAVGYENNILGEETAATVPSGNVKIQVSGVYAAHVDWSYYALGEGQALPQELGAGEGTPIDEQNPSQQLGSINNPAPTININQEGLKEDCVTFYWDPYGRVFDTQSLEPMSGIKVTLLDDLGKPAVIDGPLKNYDITKIDNGIYNILVSKEADYQLTADPPFTHLFTKNINLHPNYSYIYSDIYLPGDIFHEVPIPQNPPKDFDYSKYHHDIPLVAKGSPYFMPEEDVIVLETSALSTDMGNFVNFKGRVTFPRAKVCLVGKETKKVYGNCVNADKYGSFSINVDKNKLTQEYLLVIPKKIDLTQPIIKSNNIDLSRIDFKDPNLVGYEPILNYVEGYIYDDIGKPMPKAKITVKLKDDNAIFYKTTADDTGFFAIYGKDLPFPEYYFEIDDEKSGQPKIVTTSKFVEMNKSYLDSEYLDLIGSTKKNQPIIDPTTGQLNRIDKNIKNINPKRDISNSIKSMINSKLIFILLILALLIPITIGMFLHIKRSSKS